MIRRLFGDRSGAISAPKFWQAMVATPTTRSLATPAVMTTAPPNDHPSSATRSAPCWRTASMPASRSEEHTSELQSLRHLVCRLLLEKKKQTLRRTTVKCNTDRNGYGG